jgi:WD40 repeat protein
VQFRHAGVSWAFAILDGGKTVLTAGKDWRLRYWDKATGKQVRSVRLEGNPRLGWGIELSADGKTLVTLHDGKFTFWEVESGKQSRTIPLPAAMPNMAFVGFSPDGGILAAGTWDPAVYLYDWKTGKERRFPLPRRHVGMDSTFHGHFSPDGKWFVAGGGVKSALCVFDLTTGREVHRLDCNATNSTVTPDSKRLVVVSCRNDRGDHETILRLFDLASGKEVAQLPQGSQSFHSLCFSPDGKTLALGFSDQSYLLDLGTGRVLFRLTGRPLRLAFTPDGKTLIGTTGTRLRFWDAANGKELHDRPGEFGYEPALAVSPDGRLLASADWMLREVSLWDTTTGRLLRLLPVKGEGRYIRNLDFSRDGTTLVGCQGVGGLIQTWDVSSGRERRTIQLRDASPPATIHGYFYRFHLLADGKHVGALERIATNEENTRAAVWDLSTGAIVRQHTLPGEIRQGTWSADGESVVLPLPEGLTKLEVGSGVAVFRAAGIQSGTPVMASLDGRLIAARKTAATLGVQEALTGREVATLAVGRCDHFALAADNRTLVSTDEGFLRVWDLATGKERLRWPLPEVMTDAAGKSFVSALALSPDGRRAFTSLADGTALVWDLTRAPAVTLVAAPSDKDLAAWWADLAADDPARAYAAIWRLRERSAAAVPLLRRHLKPARPADFDEARRLITELDNDAFEVRERASTRLTALGHTAVPALREALAKNPPLEPRRRLEKLLGTLSHGKPSPDRLRNARAIEILERIGSPEARRVLTELAGGMAEAPQTREAREALDRGQRR